MSSAQHFEIDEHQYYIEPKTALIEEIQKSGLDENAKWLLECNEYWYWPFHGIGPSKFTEQGFVTLVKLLFLAKLHNSYYDADSLPLSDIGKFCQKILELPPWSIEAFDKWWNVKLVEYDYNIEETIDSLRAEDLKVLGRTGVRAIDELITQLISDKCK